MLRENESGKRGRGLAEFARDLTAMARMGQLDPVIGRDTEITRAVQILSRRTKNNPVLIGEPGVGMTVKSPTFLDASLPIVLYTRLSYSLYASVSLIIQK